jgi:hypothetical protein
MQPPTRQNTTITRPSGGLEALSASSHPFTFNGQERTDKLAGAENHNTALYWEYNNRLGRRWKVDPKSNPQISFYACNSKSPIIYKVIPGDTIVIFMGNKEKDPVLYLASRQLIKRQVNNGDFIIVGHASLLEIQNDHSEF